MGRGPSIGKPERLPRLGRGTTKSTKEGLYLSG